MTMGSFKKPDPQKNTEGIRNIAKARPFLRWGYILTVVFSCLFPIINNSAFFILRFSNQNNETVELGLEIPSSFGCLAR